MQALYLALTTQGMMREAGRNFGRRFDPLTICSYDVDVDDLMDLRAESDRAATGFALSDMACAWEQDLSDGRTPASWAMADDLARKGIAGILTPSFARGAPPGMANLVLWRWGPDLPHKVSVHDPAARLPKDQSSWP